MLQIPAGIFPGFHGRFQTVLRYRDPDIGWLLVCDSGDVANSHFKAPGATL